MEEFENLIDVFMPRGLCARCDELPPQRTCFLDLTPSPSSTRSPEGTGGTGVFEPARVFFCGRSCRESFVVGWTAARTLSESL